MMASSSRDRKVMWVSGAILVANMCVAIGKLAYGASLSSLAITADGFHSLLDGVNNVVIIVAMGFAGRPADDNHPYGHRKFEVLAGLMIGVMILYLVVRTAAGAITSLLAAPTATLASDAYIVVFVTLGINVVVTVFEHRAGKRLKSELLIADARHTLSDVAVSGAVLAGVYANRLGFQRGDAIASLAVTGVIAWVGYGVMKQAIAGLADEVGLPSDVIRDEVLRVPGVAQVRRVRSRKYGGEIKVDVAIGVDGTLTVAEAHAIADQVEAALSRRWPEASDTLVHVEPRTNNELA